MFFYHDPKVRIIVGRLEDLCPTLDQVANLALFFNEQKQFGNGIDVIHTITLGSLEDF